MMIGISQIGEKNFAAEGKFKTRTRLASLTESHLREYVKEVACHLWLERILSMKTAFPSLVSFRNKSKSKANWNLSESPPTFSKASRRNTALGCGIS
jgi:hypothetical protein